jgi:hypothetical protein
MGVEAGQTVEEILRRKDLERECGDGVFAWGIGNSVGPALQQARRLANSGSIDALFTKMKSLPSPIDTSPGGVVMWRGYCLGDGSVRPLPSHMLITSRQHAASGAEKRHHFALFCRSPESIFNAEEEVQIDSAYARNLVSNGKVGSSQVTAVVSYSEERTVEIGRRYSVLFRATLTGHAFVRLAEPVPLSGSLANLYRAACRAADAAAWRRRMCDLIDAAFAIPFSSHPPQASFAALC